MAELNNRIREWMRGPATGSDLSSRQQAARTQLRGHIDAGLLDGFIRRRLSPEQHSVVLGHLNRCHDCQEAIAVVLLAHEDPSAAAQIVLETEKRARHRGLWWKIALRWTGVVVAFFALVLLVFLLPATNNPDSFLGKLFRPEAPKASLENSAESNTSVGSWIVSTFSNDEASDAGVEHAKRPGKLKKQVSPGWDTGPAAYHDKVEGMPGPIEVEIKAEEARPVTAASSNTERAASAHSGSARHVISQRRLVVTNKGELMRTMDGGATWRIITIDRGLVFRTLAVSGSTIWAAGNAGALYRSPDDAERWQQVTLKYRGVPVSSDITHIHFSDPQHGSLHTADGQIWITVNAGANWVLNYKPNSTQ